MLKQQIKEKEGKNDNELINKNRELEKKILDKIEQIEGLRIALNKLSDEREEFIMKQSNKKNTLSKKSSKDNNELISNDTELKMELKDHIKDNICTPEFLYDYVDRHNYVDFLDINRIKKDEKLIEKDDIFVSINSKAYINKN